MSGNVEAVSGAMSSTRQALSIGPFCASANIAAIVSFTAEFPLKTNSHEPALGLVTAAAMPLIGRG